MLDRSTGNSSLLKIIAAVLFISFPIVGFVLGVKYQGVIDLPASQVSPLIRKPTVKLESLDTSNWKTYTNAKYGYQFKYPNYWQIRDEDSSIESPLVTPISSVLGKNLHFDYIKRDINGVTDQQEQMYVFVLDNPKQLKLKEYFIDQRWGNDWLDQMEYTVINNIETVNLKFSGSLDSYYLNFGKYIVHLVFSYTGAHNKFDIQPKQTFSQILSTFKFLDQNDETAGWKTYKNATFSFKYPANWEEPKEYQLSTRNEVVFSGADPLVEKEMVSTKLDVTSGIYYSQDLQRGMTLEEIISQKDLSYFPSPKDCPFPGCTSEVKKSDFVLGNLKGVKYTIHVHGVGGFMTEIYLSHSFTSSDLLIITYLHSLDESEMTNPNPEVLTQILSTFKFVDPTPTPQI